MTVIFLRHKRGRRQSIAPDAEWEWGAVRCLEADFDADTPIYIDHLIHLIETQGFITADTDEVVPID